jgi:hypothetical protein
MPRQQLGQKLLMNRHLARAQRRQFLLIVIDQHDLMSQIRKTHSRYQPNVSGTDHRDAHSEPALLMNLNVHSGSSECNSYCSSLSTLVSLSNVNGRLHQPRNGNSNLTKKT